MSKKNTAQNSQTNPNPENFSLFAQSLAQHIKKVYAAKVAYSREFLEQIASTQYDRALDEEMERQHAIVWLSDWSNQMVNGQAVMNWLEEGYQQRSPKDPLDQSCFYRQRIAFVVILQAIYSGDFNYLFKRMTKERFNPRLNAKGIDWQTFSAQ
jgi:hypothetical protein